MNSNFWMNWDVNASSKTEAVGLGACPDKLAEIVTRTLTVVAMNCATQGKTTPIAMEVELFNQCEMGDKEAQLVVAMLLHIGLTNFTNDLKALLSEDDDE